jgi:glycosyltransferase involved in cell wall biosynthesis
MCGVSSSHRDDNNVSVLVVADFGFPNGRGATSRALAYATGLLANNARVKVLCVEPSERVGGAANNAARGHYRGVEFEYTCGQTFRPASRGKRGFLKVAKVWRFWKAVADWSQAGGGVDAIIVYSRSILWIAVAKAACLMTGSLLVHEDCELPFGWRTEQIGRTPRRLFYEGVVFKWFDACLVISTYLRDYCVGHMRRGARALLVPIMVDVSEFDGLEGMRVRDVVAYCGYSTHPDVASLIDVFALVAPSHPELRLEVIGGTLRPEQLPGVWDHAERAGVADRLDLVGMVARAELLPMLCSARVLVLPRPDAPFSRAGLPTKLGDYLASSRPVVVSAVGDIPLYVRDGVDAYLVPPDDVEAFADRIRHVLSSRDEAAEVARRGRETAQRQFDPALHGRRIVEFVRDRQATSGQGGRGCLRRSSRRREAISDSSTARVP